MTLISRVRWNITSTSAMLRRERERHFLIIGPWIWGNPMAAIRVWRLRLGPASVIDIRALHHEWYAWTMPGGPRPDCCASGLAYYEMGHGTVRHADTLEAITVRHESYFLDSR